MIPKFRAWDKKTKRMLTPEYTETVMALMGWSGGEDEDYIYMQFTGLKDLKRTKEYPEGQEIYEGDIVETGDRIGYVRYRADACSMEFEIKALTGDAWYDYMGPKWSIDELEVIGNRFENPELLELL